MSAEQPHVERMPLTKIRGLILAGLTIGVAIFATAVFILVQRIFDNFGPAVKTDLHWKVQRGAQEIARGADLGLAIQDAAEVAKTFEHYQKSDDVLAIVAVDAEDKVVARFGETDRFGAQLFEGAPEAVAVFDGYLISWAPALIEGGRVGRVALVMSTHRLTESELFLDQIRLATLAASLLSLILGAVFVIYSTRAIALRDAQLAEYASGLEKKVEERTRALDARNRGMRLVLDNVEEGLVTITLDGRISGERSRAIDNWFGPSSGDIQFADLLRSGDPKAATWFALGFDQICENLLPLELLLDQLPRRMTKDQRVFDLRYRPIQDATDNLEGLLGVFSDVTEKLVHERLEAEQAEMLALFQRFSADRTAFLDFFEEANDLVSKISSAAESAETEKRLVHTLKGNAGMFGLKAITELCDQLETRMAEDSSSITAEERERLRKCWTDTHQRMSTLIGTRRKTLVEIEKAELERVIHMLESDASRTSIAATLRSYFREPVQLRFERLAEQAKHLALRLGKPPLDVRIESGDIRLDAEVWRPFWSAFVHAIRNAVDHGIERAELRRAKNKPEAGTLVFAAKNEQGDLTITLSDDGSGIDWQNTRARAQISGLRAEDTDDLRAALFEDGFTTRDKATEVSGRGVGMGALREATEALGGSVHVRSVTGRGTELEFRFRQFQAEQARSM